MIRSRLVGPVNAPTTRHQIIASPRNSDPAIRFRPVAFEELSSVIHLWALALGRRLSAVVFRSVNSLQVPGFQHCTSLSPGTLSANNFQDPGLLYKHLHM